MRCGDIKAHELLQSAEGHVLGEADIAAALSGLTRARSRALALSRVNEALAARSPGARERAELQRRAMRLRASVEHEIARVMLWPAFIEALAADVVTSPGDESDARVAHRLAALCELKIPFRAGWRAGTLTIAPRRGTRLARSNDERRSTCDTQC